MSLFMTSEVLVLIRIKMKDHDGNEHVRELGINADQTFDDIFLAAHQNPDGKWPTLAQCGGDSSLWSSAVRLLELEHELRPLCDPDFKDRDSDPGFIPWPSDQPPRFNACTDPCDMWTGPCACGAWHKDGR